MGFVRGSKTFLQGSDIATFYSEAERCLWLVWTLYEAMRAEELREYFCCPVSAYLTETVAALRRLECDECAGALQSGISIFFRDQEPEASSGVGMEEMGRLRGARYESLSDDEWDRLEVANQQFLDAAGREGLMARLVAFWNSHRMS